MRGTLSCDEMDEQTPSLDAGAEDSHTLPTDMSDAELIRAFRARVDPRHRKLANAHAMISHVINLALLGAALGALRLKLASSGTIFAVTFGVGLVLVCLNAWNTYRSRKQVQREEARRLLAEIEGTPASSMPPPTLDPERVFELAMKTVRVAATASRASTTSRTAAAVPERLQVAVAEHG